MKLPRCARPSGVRALLWAAGLLVLLSGAAPAATIAVSPGQGLAAALARAVDGDVIELAAGDYRGEVGVITHKRLTLRGVGGRPVLHAAGRSAEGKAIWVVRSTPEGSDIRIENIEFRGARVADRNGAGIRFEQGRLHVLRCVFVDNENGILTTGFPEAELRIEDSDFSDAPAATPLPHLLYVGAIGKLTVTGSRFRNGRDGHLIKSRALVSEIRQNVLVDGPGGAAAYELEFPNGGQVTVVGNRIGQGAGTSNPAIVSFGTEGYGQRALSFVFNDNTVINEAPRPAQFLRVRDAGRPFEQRIVNNRFFGAGDLGPATAAQGNIAASLSAYTPGPLPGAPPSNTTNKP